MEEETYNHPGEEEGTGGLNHLSRQNLDYAYGEEGAVDVG